MRKAIVKVQGQDHEFAHGLRPMFLFEQITKKTFALETVTDTIMFYWCCFISADPSFMSGNFSIFVDAIDDDPTLSARCAEALKTLSEKAAAMDGRDTENAAADDKKKD